MTHDKSPCQCGSGEMFSACCEPILNDHSRAGTALQLMRSRYTAFIHKHDRHILASWDPSTRPRALNHEDHPVSWVGLQIHETDRGQEKDTEGTVTFTASYIENGQFCHLREKSRFRKENDLWFYINGECDLKKEKIARNSACPCGSGKKFKRCCLQVC